MESMPAKTEMEVLLNKGKRVAAALIKCQMSNAGCQRSTRPDNLNGLLDMLLDPLKAIDEWETIEWLKWLMAGGQTPDEFASTVRRYDNATTCGLVWTANFVAYRCRTCGISPCMSLCAECFQRGNHKGHDFNMFRSQAGGACDCGDTNVMKSEGFCYLHGPHAPGEEHTHDKPGAPPDLLCVANSMMPRLILRLIQHMRQNSVSLDGFLGAVQAADKFITMLYDLSSMGAAMRQVMTQALTNTNVYRSLMEMKMEGGSQEYEEFLNNIDRCYEDALGTLRNPLPPIEFEEIPSLQKTLVHRTFLQELVFWTAKFEFPQKIVCLLLNLLPDAEYKEAFTRAFVLHYSRISQLLVKSQDPDMLSNRVVHVSVQLFSNEKLALRMTEQMNLLHVMVISLHYMMHDISINSPLHEKDGIFIRVVDCGNSVMKDHCYWPLVSDLNNILSHRPVALKFLEDDGLLQMWFHFLSMFQGMNLNQREMNQHIEFEPTTYYAAFSAELEASASPMWALVSHLRDASTAHLTKNLLWHCKQQLRRWLEYVKFGMHEHESLQVSFHLPLHRYFAVFLYQAVRNQGLSLSELLPPPNELKLIILHPLRVQVAFYEIISGLWVRNGLQIKGQAMTYIQCHFCNSMVDADLFLLQVGLMNIPRSDIITSIFEKFHIMDSLSISSAVTNTYLEPDQEMLMMENCLIFLATLSSVRTAIGMSDADLITLEMVTLLCMGDKTHSQLMELMPERCGNSSQSKDFEAVLAKVADYKAPNFESSGNMLQGMYVPKSFVWETLYDPIYILLRAVHRRDFQTSMDRFTEFAKQSGKFKSCSGSPWPPFRIPGEVSAPYTDPRHTLLSRVVQSVLFVIFYKAVHTSNLSDQVVALAVYLLEMALSVCDEPGNASALAQQEEETFGRYDMEFETWFATDNLLSNLRTEIDSVLVKSQTREMDVETSDAVEISMDEMDVESYDGESEMLDIEDSYGTLSAFNPAGEYGTMETTGEIPIPRPSGALALMPPNSPPTEFQLGDYTFRQFPPPVGMIPGTAMVPAMLSPSNVASASVGNTVHQRVLEVVLAATSKRMSNSQRKQIQYDRSSSMGGNQPPSEIMINESLISLLLKLHSKLACTPDSYIPFWESPLAEKLITDARNGVDNGLIINSSPEDPSQFSFSYSQLYELLFPEDIRIGDGSFFVKKLLDKIGAKDELCRQNVIQVREKLWPRQAEDEETVRAREEKEKEEKRKKAKDRQSKLMAEFAKKQQQFMEKAMTEEYREESGMCDESSSDSFSSPFKDDLAEAIKPIEYDCVICNQTSASTIDNPVGLVILLQPSSLLGHRTKQGSQTKVLPTCEEEVLRPGPSVNSSACHTMVAHFEKRLEMYKLHFDESSWLQSMSSGWEGGVHVSTCGHHIHMECLKGYLSSLKSQQRQHNISVERGEYLCPLCRQLANSFLPLSPEFGIRQSALVKDRKTSQTPLTPEATVPEIPPSPESNVALEVLKLLREYAFPSAAGKMMDAMTKTMEEMTNATLLKYRQVGSSKNTKSILLFVTSISRTNLELELVFRGGHLVSDPQPSTSSNSSSAPSSSSVSKRSCIVPLLHVLGVHYKILSAEPCAPKMWERILGIRFFPDSSLMPIDHEVPMLLRDPVTILLHLLMQLPMHVDLAYYTSMVQGIYNLVYIQILCALSCSFKESEREEFKTKMSFYSSTANANELFFLLGTVIRYLEKFPFYLSDSDLGAMDYEDMKVNFHKMSQEEVPSASQNSRPSNSASTSSPSCSKSSNILTLEEELEKRVENLLLPYLRVSSLLRHHIYEQDLPIITSVESEFRSLAQFLGLGVGGTVNTTTEVLNERRKKATKSPSLSFFFPAHSFFSWISPTPLTTIWTWCEDLSNFIQRAQVSSAQLVKSHHTLWNQPKLMELPHAYDTIFQFYHRKQCHNCNSVPKDPNICLVCGTLVCMRDTCCKQSSTGTCEAIQHSIDCGGGTVMYLSVNSSTIVVVRGRRACLWGSVYLDSFGEEDRELKRGKPLFLSKERYALLQQQWLSHRFDHTTRKWIWHRDNL